MPLQLDALRSDLKKIRLIVNGRLQPYEGKYLLSVDWVGSTYGVTSEKMVREKEVELRQILARHGLREESFFYIRARIARGKWWYTFFIGIRPEAILGEGASD